MLEAFVRYSRVEFGFRHKDFRGNTLGRFEGIHKLGTTTNNCRKCSRCGFNSDGHDAVYDRLRTRATPWLGMFRHSQIRVCFISMSMAITV